MTPGGEKKKAIDDRLTGIGLCLAAMGCFLMVYAETFRYNIGTGYYRSRKYLMLWEVHLLFGFDLMLASRTCRSSKEGLSYDNANDHTSISR